MASKARERLVRVLASLEEIVSQDPGKRGVPFLRVPHALVGAACTIGASKRPMLLTGFPCRLDDDPPTENDGPAGVGAIARLCARLGKGTSVVTDVANTAVVFAACSAAWDQGLGSGGASAAGGISFVGVSPAGEGAEEAARSVRDSAASAAGCDSVVAIERAGKAIDGSYRTMRGRRMDHLIAPLGVAAGEVARLQGEGSPLLGRVVGVGDGGNEFGMGSVESAVVARIPSGREIACVEACDFLVAAGVSNWGGWALAAATEAALRTLGEEIADEAADAPWEWPVDGVSSAPGLSLSPGEALDALWRSEEARRCARLLSGSLTLVPTPEEELAVMGAVASAGGRDGITGDLSGRQCDGLWWESHEAVLLSMREALMAISR
jgi:hypothetical protein